MMLALLSAADRFDQQAQIGEREGDLVISDRYYLSGLAYHAADGIDQAVYQRLNDGVRRPDLYLFLHLDPRAAAARLGGRTRDRWERGPVAAAVPHAYEAALRLVQATENALVAWLDAAAPAHDVLGQALTALAPLITNLKEHPRG
jgi:dTMP kinase